MSQADRPVIPNVFLPRALGVGHIVSAVVLTGVSLLWGVYFLGIPLFFDFVREQAAERVATRAEADRQAMEKLDEQIAATAEGKARDDLQAQRLELQVNQEIPMESPRIPLFGMTNPRVAGTIGFEIFSGLFLYFLMLIAGIGLFRLRRWGRTLALGVAVLKCAQVVLVGGLIGLAAAPAMSAGVRDEMTDWRQEMAERPADESADADAEPVPPPRMTPEEMGETVGQLLRIHAVGTVVFGLVYPVITLAILRQRSVRAVFDGDRPGPAQAELS